jgi:ribosomal protein S18 acetylase RimI-like enzyme
MSSSRPERGRTPTVADAAPIAALLNRIADGEDSGWVDEAELRDWLTAQGNDPGNFQVFEQDGELAAYADVFVPGASGKAWLDVRIPREHDGGPVEEAALDWCERRSRELGAASALLPLSEGSPLAARLERRGYRYVRSRLELEIELGEPPVAPAWPDGIAVRTMRPGEEPAVYEAHQQSFADHWEFTRLPYESWLGHLHGVNVDLRLWFLAVDGDEIAGVCLCGPRRRGDERIGWVSVLGVLPPWRRRGLGRALLLHGFGELHRRGFARAGLGVDAENTTGAVRLYEQGGMRVVHRADRYELVLG